jgi:hypothetical protein
MLHSKSARAETGRAPVFLAVIRLVFMLPIRETDSHPRLMCVLLPGRASAHRC